MTRLKQYLLGGLMALLPLPLMAHPGHFGHFEVINQIFASLSVIDYMVIAILAVLVTWGMVKLLGGRK